MGSVLTYFISPKQDDSKISSSIEESDIDEQLPTGNRSQRREDKQKSEQTKRTSLTGSQQVWPKQLSQVFSSSGQSGPAISSLPLGQAGVNLEHISSPYELGQQETDLAQKVIKVEETHQIQKEIESAELEDLKQETPSQEPVLDFSELKIDLRFTLFAPGASSQTTGSNVETTTDELKAQARRATLKAPRKVALTQKNSVASASMATSPSCASPSLFSRKQPKKLPQKGAGHKTMKPSNGMKQMKASHQDSTTCLPSGTITKSQSLLNQSSFATAAKHGCGKNLNQRKLGLARQSSDSFSQSTSSLTTSVQLS